MPKLPSIVIPTSFHTQVSQQLCDLRNICGHDVTKADIDKFFSKVDADSLSSLQGQYKAGLSASVGSEPNPDPTLADRGQQRDLTEAMDDMNMDTSRPTVGEEEAAQNSDIRDDDGWTVVNKGKKKQT